MKQIILIALALFFVTASYSQSKKEEPDTSIIDKFYLRDSSFSGYTLAAQQPSRVLIYGADMTNRVDLTIQPNGDVYYRPSAFCDCEKCKAYKGMKYWRNLFKP